MKNNKDKTIIIGKIKGKKLSEKEAKEFAEKLKDVKHTDTIILPHTASISTVGSKKKKNKTPPKVVEIKIIPQYELKIVKHYCQLASRKFLQFSWAYGTRGVGITLPFRSLEYCSEGTWLIVYKSFKPSCSATTIERLNKIPYIIQRLRYHYMMFDTWRKEEKYKRCQGCGTGLSEYKIRDPNQGSGNRWFNCCKGCVNFYDMRWSQMKIVKWKNGKAICKRREKR